MVCELTLLEPIDAPWPCGRTGDVAWLDHDMLLGEPAHDGRCAVFSGSLGASRFDADVRSWLPGARETLAESLSSCPLNVLLRPHHAHILSDVPGTRSMLEGRCPRPVALDVGALLTSSMALDAAPHLDRIVHGLGPMADAILLGDLRIDESGHPVACPMGEGILPGGVLGDSITQLFAHGVSDDVVVGVMAVDIDAAARWLGWLSCAHP